MRKYYLAITYDVCEHNNLYEDMNEYPIDSSENLAEKVREIAKQDIAPVVKVYESGSSDFKDQKLYKEFIYKEFECSCTGGEL